MKKKYIKILTTLLTIAIIIFSCNTVFGTISQNFSGASAPVGSDMIKKIISSILALVRTIGVVVAIVILMIIGCKYMMSSPGERADIKKHAVNYVIGAVVLFASSGLISIIKSFVDGSFGTN